MSEFETLTIICQDHYPLYGRFYPVTSSHKKTLPILVCPATGISTQFYHQFNLWLQQQGYDVLCFDFRGIGQSLHGPLKHSSASIVQWGQLDIPAAIDALITRTQAEQVILLGHSAGGQLLGIAANFRQVAKVIAIAGSTGHVKGLKGRTKWLAPVMFNFIFPISRPILGYGPTQAIGMGANLPKNVARQWAQFCSQPGYIINAIDDSVDPEHDFHSQIECPVIAIYSSDDEIATLENVEDLLRLYPNAKTSITELIPQQYGHQQIGHMSMFKRSHQNLWSVIEQHCAL